MMIFLSVLVFLPAFKWMSFYSTSNCANYFTGSNSVNVFLGLGLPWVLSSLWHRYYIGIDLRVASGNVTQAVILFCVIGTICLVVLFIRRMVRNTAYVIISPIAINWKLF